MRRRENAHELLDGELEPRTLHANLRDLARANRFLGGVDLTWRALEPLLRAHEGTRALRLLDVGTGGADIPLALTRRAQGARRSLEILATDVRPEIIEAAAERTAKARASSVALSLAPADRIDEPDRSFDVVHASLVLHHLDPTAAAGLLREMARVANRAVIVNDLDRARRWWAGAWLLSHLATGNRYTRHDAPLSVRRAYRPAEVTQMASGVGLREIRRFTARPAYRYALVFEPNGSPADGRPDD